MHLFAGRKTFFFLFAAARGTLYCTILSGGIFLCRKIILLASTELAELLGIKSAAKGIKVQIVDGTMTVDTIITVRYGCSVVAVAKAVQESVTSAVESMTGMGKPIVNVHVSGVAFDK